MTSSPDPGGYPPPSRPLGKEATTHRDVARVATVAEAGYLIGLLDSARVASSIRSSESFSAVDGAWSTTYTVSVAEQDVDLAARLLQAEAQGILPTSNEADRSIDAAQQVNPWSMLAVLAIIAAGAAWALTQRTAPPERKQPERRQRGAAAAAEAEPIGALAEAVSRSGATFYTDDPQRPRQRLRYLQRSQQWVLSTDADRDGRYESHRRFNASAPLVGEAAAR